MIKINLAPIVFIYANIIFYFILGSIFINADEVSESILRMVRHRKLIKLEILNSKIVWTDNRIWSKSNGKWKFCTKKDVKNEFLKQEYKELKSQIYKGVTVLTVVLRLICVLLFISLLILLVYIGKKYIYMNIYFNLKSMFM